MKLHRFVFRSLSITMIVALSMGSAPATGSDNPPSELARLRQSPPATLDSNFVGEIISLDPGVDYGMGPDPGNLFIGLTRLERATKSTVKPALATAWDVSEDGLVWTFYLRNDVNWMRYNPATDTAEVVRPVVASDMVFAIHRLCDPRMGNYGGTILATVIAGCDRVNGTPVEEVTDDLAYGDTTRVVAPDDTTIVIELQFPATYFLTMTTMWMVYPVPPEIIAEHGEDWTSPGTFVNNGPYFFKEYVPGVRAVFVRNPYLPADLYGGDGNIEIVNMVNYTDSVFSAYLSNEIDSSWIPDAERPAVLVDPAYQDQIVWGFDNAVFYFGFSYDKPPFDNVHVRRALSAIIDRQLFIDQLHDGLDYPMIHFTPPGIVHAPPINEVGLGFAPDVAVEEFALAGFPNCKGFPETTITTYEGAGAWGAFWASKMEEYLGCAPDVFHVDEMPFFPMITLLDEGTSEERPGLWIQGWGPDYNDANNFLGDVLYCGVDTNMRRPCTVVDDMLEQAKREPDPQVRTQLYAQIEEAFFGREGEFPIAPLFVRRGPILVKPWYTGPHAVGGLWTEFSIDMAAKLAARGG